MKELEVSSMTILPGRKKVGLPPRVFLYTLDQLSVMLEVSIPRIQQHYIYFEGRSIGSRRKNLMIAHNIAPPNIKPEWRVVDREFIRWMRNQGFRYYEVSGFSN